MECKHTKTSKYYNDVIFCDDCNANLSNDPVKKIVDHSDTYIDSPPLRYRGDTVYTSDYVDGLKKEIEELKKDLEFNNFKKTSLDSQLYTENIHLKERCQSQSNDITELTKSWENSKKSLNYNLKKVEVLEDENNLLKTQLAELHQANVNLFNESENLKKEVVFGVLKKPFDKDSYNLQEIKELKTQVLETNEINLKLNLENEKLKQDLELKEIINQDLVKKYQLLEEEIQAYDINMLELVESYKKLEQDYNDSKRD